MTERTDALDITTVKIFRSVSDMIERVRRQAAGQ